MRLIAHRGNYKGRVEERENHPAHIAEALCAGFDVEIDVWAYGSKFYLGHDEPVYPMNPELMFEDRVWVHAKNPQAVEMFIQVPYIHFFWHENDYLSVTSKNYLWTCQPSAEGLNTIYMDIHPTESLRLYNPFNVGGICSDNLTRFCVS